MLLLCIASLALTALPSAAQQNPQSQEKSGTQEPAETLKVNVNVVNLYFVTKDKHGTLVPNLGRINSRSWKTASRRPSAITKLIPPNLSLLV